MWGTLVWRSGRECRLKDARQQRSWSRNALTLFALVTNGPHDTGLTLDVAVEEIDMTEICGVILVPPARAEEFKAWPAG